MERIATGELKDREAVRPGNDHLLHLHCVARLYADRERIEALRFRDKRPEDATIRQYGSPSAATGAMGAADLESALALAMYQSAKQNVPVEVPLVDEEAVW